MCVCMCVYESMYVFVHLLCTSVCACVHVCALNQSDALWDMTPCNLLLYPEAGGGCFLRNIRTYPHNYTVSHSISQQSARAPSLLIFERVLCPYFSHVSAAACLLQRSVSRSTLWSVSICDSYCQQAVWTNRLHCSLMCCTVFTSCYQIETKQPQQTWYERLYDTTSKTTNRVVKLQYFDIVFCACFIYFCACALLWCWDLWWLVFRLVQCRLNAGLPPAEWCEM